MIHKNNKYCIPKRRKMSKLLLEKQLDDHLYWRYRTSIKMKFKENVWGDFLWTELGHELHHPKDCVGCLCLIPSEEKLGMIPSVKGHMSQISDSHLQNQEQRWALKLTSKDRWLGWDWYIEEENVWVFSHGSAGRPGAILNLAWGISV